MNNSEPLLSIITPVYNAEKYIRECIDSILANEYQNFELILSNDGSTDGSLAICREYAEKDSRIIVIDSKHGGVSIARNRGIEQSKGEWIGFVDADDTIAPSRFSEAINAANEYGTQMVSCAIMKITDGKTSNVMKLYDPGIIDFGGSTTIFGLCTNHVFKASIIKDNGIRFQDCDYGEDSVFTLQVFFFAGRTYNIGRPLYYLRRGHESLSRAPMTEERKQRLLQAAKSAIEEVHNRREDFSVFADVLIGYLSSKGIK